MGISCLLTNLKGLLCFLLPICHVGEEDVPKEQPYTQIKDLVIEWYELEVDKLQGRPHSVVRLIITELDRVQQVMSANIHGAWRLQLVAGLLDSPSWSSRRKRESGNRGRTPIGQPAFY